MGYGSTLACAHEGLRILQRSYGGGSLFFCDRGTAKVPWEYLHCDYEGE